MSDRIRSFLELAVNQGGSDLHLVSGMAPGIRIRGRLHRVRFRELSTEDLEQILQEIMTVRQAEVLGRERSVDFAHDVPGLGRFRANVYRHARGLAAAFRVIPAEIPALDSLGLPGAVKLHTLLPKGLVLVTGPTGSGKSTTLASMVDLINATRKAHIVTLEDPIEFLHAYKRSVVTQREIGLNAPTFAEGLRDALREDPDVLLVGELRDLESISLALRAAETGIQVLATLHTSGAKRTVDRIINVYPSRRQDQVRSMLAESLRLVVSQRLVRSADGSRRIAVSDVLVNTYAAASMIRTGNSHKLDSVIQAGSSVGMQAMDVKLRELLRAQLITNEEASANALEPGQFEHLLAREAA